MELRPYQEAARQSIQEEWGKGVQKTLLVLPTGCHAKGSKLLKSDGHIELVEKLKVGDKLMGPDGKERTILHVQNGIDYLYKITPVKGNPFMVTADHKLSLVRTNEKSRKKYPSDFKGGEIIDVEVREWLTWSKNKKHIHKLFRSSYIQKINEMPLTIDPYFLGILLGDGDIKSSISITTMDSEIVEEINKQCFCYGMSYRTESAGKANTYFFQSHEVGAKGGKLHRELLELNLRYKGSRDKFVPFEYKTNNADIRLQVIAGLIDTDGSLSGNVYDFISASEQLSNDLAFMCRSVGLAAYVKPCEKCSQNGTIGTYYRVSISGNLNIIPCRVAHKKAKKRTQKKNHLRTGFKVEKIEKGEYFGFTVDGDNRYLLDDFTVTHNCGKTVVFAKVAEDRVRQGDRVLILAHRGELLDQAADKILKTTGLRSALEKAESSCLGQWESITVGSVQSLMREKRLQRFSPNYFGTIIVDEAHHVISDSYQRVLGHFCEAKVLGVTATPDRGDMKNLGAVFESLAYEYTLPKAIKEGYLSPIKAMTIPLKLDLSSVGISQGDFKVGDLGNALDPYLEAIAEEMKTHCEGRKTVVFLPLVKTSQKFRDILNAKGFQSAEVNGESKDREEVLKDFDEGKYNVLCNSMLLTEGWDCPSVDCVVVLRPTKIRSLYCQMVGRGTRLAEGKSELLLLDFLWHTERHELCHPAHLICESEEVAKKMTEKLEEAAGCPMDIEEAAKEANEDTVREREEALASQLSEMKKRKGRLVDPLQYEMSIQDSDLVNYVPAFGWQMAPASPQQIQALEKFGIAPDAIDNAGKATLLLEKLIKRKDAGLASPKQINRLEKYYHFKHVGTWQFESARKMIDRIAANGWRIPYGVDPATYKPNEA